MGSAEPASPFGAGASVSAGVDWLATAGAVLGAIGSGPGPRLDGGLRKVEAPGAEPGGKPGETNPAGKTPSRTPMGLGSAAGGGGGCIAPGPPAASMLMHLTASSAHCSASTICSGWPLISRNITSPSRWTVMRAPVLCSTMRTQVMLPPTFSATAFGSSNRMVSSSSPDVTAVEPVLPPPAGLTACAAAAAKATELAPLTCPSNAAKGFGLGGAGTGIMFLITSCTIA
mmetsp:Transcript_115177/g.211822  ORF Transcript_115177/g.211822 Transcript_115177/m.211822 type:complete len:229 (-) Transcript_115177:1098-1784(-)